MKFKRREILAIRTGLAANIATAKAEAALHRTASNEPAAQRAADLQRASEEVFGRFAKVYPRVHFDSGPLARDWD